MRNYLDRIVITLAFICFITFFISCFFIYIITNGIRINHKCDVAKNNLELVQYEQVYHVFMDQEIFLKITNNSDKMIGTLTIKEKNSGIEETINKIRPGYTLNMYFNLNNRFKDVEFEIVKLKFVEMD